MTTQNRGQLQDVCFAQRALNSAQIAAPGYYLIFHERDSAKAHLVANVLL
ncbi:MAG: hypothetical protein ABI839_05480 [Verrucomicrobiota bacterium]